MSAIEVGDGIGEDHVITIHLFPGEREAGAQALGLGNHIGMTQDRQGIGEKVLKEQENHHVLIQDLLIVTGEGLYHQEMKQLNLNLESPHCQDLMKLYITLAIRKTTEGKKNPRVGVGDALGQVLLMVENMCEDLPQVCWRKAGPDIEDVQDPDLKKINIK